MKKTIIILLLVLHANLFFAKGLRYSVCQVTPEFTDAEKALFSETALLFSRFEKKSESRTLQMVSRPGYYGSGVVVERNGLCLLTTRQVLMYAGHATVTVYLHDKTLRFRGCEVIGSDVASGLALVQLPQSDELEALALGEMPVDESDDVSAAGYANLNNQPTWQLVHGFVSNTHLKMQERTYVQHTAPFNAGMAGGPLLQKKEGQYRLIGINAGAVTNRDEMALSVRAEDVKTAMKSGFLHSDNADLLLCTKDNMENWFQLLKQMTKEELDSLMAVTSDMPLDLIVRVLENKVVYEKRAADREHARLNKRGVVSDISRIKQNVFYHNYLSASNQEAGIGMEFALGKRKMAFIGMQFACSFTEASPISLYPYGGYMGYVYYTLYDPKPVFSPLFGLYTGFQLPIRVGNKHVLVPRISQGGNIGPCVNTYDEPNDKYSVGTLLITSDSRFGLEYHYQMEKIALIMALEYTAHVFATDADVVYRYKDGSRVPMDERTQFLYESDEIHIGNNCFNHGIGVRFAVGF